MKVTTSYVLTPEEINDLMVCALEGAINYWCSSATIEYDEETGLIEGVALKDMEKVECASDVIGYHGTLLLLEDGGEVHRLNRENLRKGIEKGCEHWDFSINSLMDDHDADIMDTIIQFAIFDEIVYG
jgi:hypothetical protein